MWIYLLIGMVVCGYFNTVTRHKIDLPRFNPETLLEEILVILLDIILWPILLGIIIGIPTNKKKD
jgi:hypothetical protein